MHQMRSRKILNHAQIFSKFLSIRKRAGKDKFYHFPEIYNLKNVRKTIDTTGEFCSVALP